MSTNQAARGTLTTSLPSHSYDCENDMLIQLSATQELQNRLSCFILEPHSEFLETNIGFVNRGAQWCGALLRAYAATEISPDLQQMQSYPKAKQGCGGADVMIKNARAAETGVACRVFTLKLHLQGTSG